MMARPVRLLTQIDTMNSVISTSTKPAVKVAMVSLACSLRALDDGGR